MRISSRVTNLMVRRARPVYRHFWSLHRWMFVRTDGRRFGRVVGAPVACLTVTGRRSGLPRSVLVVYASKEDDLIVCGSHAGHPSTPAWYRNLVAAGRAEVLVDGARWAVSAREVTGEERADCWRRIVAVFPQDADYQSLSGRLLPIAVLSPIATSGTVHG